MTRYRGCPDFRFWIGSGKKRWAVVAAPGVVGGNVVEGDVFQVADEGASLGQDFGAAGEDVDGFVFGEEADELGELGGDRFKVIGPGVWIAWPGEPDAGLGLPLRRPAVAELGRSWWGLAHWKRVMLAAEIFVRRQFFVGSSMAAMACGDLLLIFVMHIMQFYAGRCMKGASLAGPP